MYRVTLQNYKEDKYYPKVAEVCSIILENSREIAPIDVFQRLGVLSKSSLGKWRDGDVPYLEKVLHCNLSRANRILCIFSFHAHDLNMGPKPTAYKRNGKDLQFSKTGNKKSEDSYSKHFIVIGKEC